MGARRSWTPLEDAFLHKAVEAGKSPEEMAREIDRTPEAIRGQLKRLRISLKKVPKKRATEVYNREIEVIAFR